MHAPPTEDVAGLLAQLTRAAERERELRGAVLALSEAIAERDATRHDEWRFADATARDRDRMAGELHELAAGRLAAEARASAAEQALRDHEVVQAGLRARLGALEVAQAERDEQAARAAALEDQLAASSTALADLRRSRAVVLAGRLRRLLGRPHRASP